MRRRRLRLDGYDYSTPGAYFITVCTHRRLPLFAVPTFAESVERCWHAIPQHFDLDVLAVMPDHVHGILLLGVGAGHARPLQTVVASFKSASAREINIARDSPGGLVWQRGYFDRVVRNDSELEALREYVLANRVAWNLRGESRVPARVVPIAPWL